MLLYHYCTPATMHAVLSTQTIRLSSLTQSNDYMEGKLVAAAVGRLGLADGLSSEEVQRIQRDVEELERVYGGLGFCLSREGDLLSQWRGYASDGAGVAIGFSNGFLESIARHSLAAEGSAIALAEVKYKASEHDDLVRPIYQEVKSRLQSSEWRETSQSRMAEVIRNRTPEERQKALFEANMNISIAALSFLEYLFLLKTEGFAEEREWRLVTRHVDRQLDITGYRATADQLIPYRECKFHRFDTEDIPQIVLGPKHKTPVAVIENFLRSVGLSDTEVIRSSTSYR